MARQASTPKTPPVGEDAGSGGRLGGLLRGSMQSVAGSVGLNVPLRAVERLTGAVERAAALLERLESAGGANRLIKLLDRAERLGVSAERALTLLERIDDDTVERLNETLEGMQALREDTRAMRLSVEALASQVSETREMLIDRLDRLPFNGLRSRRRQRDAPVTGA